MIRSSSRKNRLFFLLFAALFLTLNLAAQKGSKKNELEQKNKKLRGEVEALNNMLGDIRSDRKVKMGKLVITNKKIELRQELINTINAQIREMSREIQQNEGQVEALKQNLEKLKKEYARMIVFAQRNQDAYSVLMFIFAAENFTQAYSRLKYIQQYSEFRKKQALEIINTQTALLAKLKELKEQRSEKRQLLGIEETEKEKLSSEKQEHEEQLGELQQKEKEVKTELEKKKKESIQLQAEIRRIIEEDIKRQKAAAARADSLRQVAEAKRLEELKKKKTGTRPEPVKVEKKPVAAVPEMSEESVALSEDFANNRGKLPLPIAKGVICETYGEHEHPAIKGFMMINNGLDICSARGSQARAVFEGEVTSIAVQPTGGTLVIIRHGEYLSVYCNLKDVLVKTGQKVNVKQAIGTVMEDDEGKTSMNFQIWKGQKTMDPGGWLYGAR